MDFSIVNCWLLGACDLLLSFVFLYSGRLSQNGIL